MRRVQRQRARAGQQGILGQVQGSQRDAPVEMSIDILWVGLHEPSISLSSRPMVFHGRMHCSQCLQELCVARRQLQRMRQEMHGVGGVFPFVGNHATAKPGLWLLRMLLHDFMAQLIRLCQAPRL